MLAIISCNQNVNCQTQKACWLLSVSSLVMLGCCVCMCVHTKAGANLDMFDEEQRTPLMAACENNHLDTVKYLLRAGATVSHKVGQHTACTDKTKRNCVILRAPVKGEMHPCAAKQITCRRSGAICMYLNELVCKHLALNWPLFMQMSLKVQFTNTRADSHTQSKNTYVFRELVVTEVHL